MKRMDKRVTAGDIIVLAAHDLYSGGTIEFSEWQLSVAAWKRDRSRFGMRGFEDQHPDHKRVMKEIMGNAPNNPVNRGLLHKTRPNYYELTALGRSEVAHLVEAHQVQDVQPRSPGQLYADIAKYTTHRVFLSWLKDPEEPRTWLGASAFLGMTKNDPTELRKRIREPQQAAADGLAWFEQTGREQMFRGPVGGSTPITRGDLKKLVEFVDMLEGRFETQMSAIQRRREQTAHR